jgi:signal transduction histidine kinase/CheY-like chemotaxis protein/HPt (histidine-containing phosphotransfer) domain-containing protein
MASVSVPAHSLSPRLSLLHEQRYRLRFLREDGRQTAIVTAVLCAFFMGTARNDFLLLRGGALLFIALASKGAYLIGTAVSVVLMRRARWPRQQDRAFHIALAVTAIAFLGTTLTRIPSGQIQGPLVGTGAMLAIVYFAQRGPIVPRAALGSVMVVATIVFVTVPHAAIEAPARLTSILGSLTLNIIGIVSASAFEEQRRGRFEAERRERHAREKLAVEKERAEAMARTRTAFLAAMSHEFRTPMNAVIGLSDLLLDEPLAPPHAAHIRTISESARALLGLLEDILDFTKIDAQKLTLSPAPFDLRALAASVVDMLRPAATSRSLDLSFALEPDAPLYLFGDDARLRQILVNLVCNAVKFTDSGAVTLRIAARTAASGGGQEIAFRVEDSGIGMTPEVVARLFRPFEQADGGSTRRHGGSGLGLAISKQIVAAMGGDIQVESEVGRGSVFAFTIRLAAAETPREATIVARAESRPALGILVVDDHPINRFVARAKLAQLGYDVDLANDGRNAILASSKRAYDVIFMDLHMPGMSGIEATTTIREATRDGRGPHVVAMTASVFDEDREACRQAGMHDFVGNPIDLAQLDAVLRRVAEERGAAPPLLAAAHVARVRQIEGLGEPRFFERLCQIFLVETRARLPRMKDALTRGDTAEIADDAHTLGSASATLGALVMSTLCAEVEEAARRGRIDEMGPRIDALSAQLVDVERAFTRELAGEARPATLEAS